MPPLTIEETCSNHLPMTQQHPMVPPNILLNNWESDWFNERENVDVLLIQVYQAGADAELEACCEWVDWKCSGSLARLLRNDRRPKTPSLKEQALQALDSCSCDEAGPWRLIRHALEQLPDPS